MRFLILWKSYSLLCPAEKNNNKTDEQKMFIRFVICGYLLFAISPSGQPLWQARVIEYRVVVGCSEEDELDAFWTIEAYG